MSARLRRLVAAIALGASCLEGCRHGPEIAPPPVVLPAPARVVFTDVTAGSGLASFRHVAGRTDKRFIVEAVSGGVALLDHDGDGSLDAYLTNCGCEDVAEGGLLPGCGGPARDALFRGDGQGRFTDVTDAAGLGDAAWTYGVAVADYDDDGLPDIYLANWGPNVLYRNDGDGTFTDVSAAAGVGDPRWSTGAQFFDFDRDGDLDLYVANYVDFDPAFEPRDLSFCQWRGIMVLYGPRGLRHGADRLYRNEGDGTFADVTVAAGIADSDGYGFQPVAFDADDDGDLDVFVANDSTPNFLWINNGDGTFVERGLQSGTALTADGRAQGSMGVALGDFDGGGRLDLFVTNFAEDHYTLYRNDGQGLFTDVTHEAGLAEATYPWLGWGAGFLDHDNDGDQDLFAANGHVYPQVDAFGFRGKYRQRNQLFENEGDGRFREVTAESGPGFAREASARGAAFGDVDNDGDVDVLVGNMDLGPTLLRNDGGNAREWLLVRPVGTRSPRDPVGAVVTVTAGGRAQSRAFESSGSFLSASDPRLHFGLGEARGAEAVLIRWPSGHVDRLGPAPAGHLLVVEEGRGVVEQARLR